MAMPNFPQARPAAQHRALVEMHADMDIMTRIRPDHPATLQAQCLAKRQMRERQRHRRLQHRAESHLDQPGKLYVHDGDACSACTQPFWYCSPLLLPCNAAIPWVSLLYEALSDYQLVRLSFFGVKKVAVIQTKVKNHMKLQCQL